MGDSKTIGDDSKVDCHHILRESRTFLNYNLIGNKHVLRNKQIQGDLLGGMIL